MIFSLEELNRQVLGAFYQNIFDRLLSYGSYCARIEMQHPLVIKHIKENPKYLESFGYKVHTDSGPLGDDTYFNVECV